MASGNVDEHTSKKERSCKKTANPTPPPSGIYTTRRQAAKNASKAIASSAFDKSMETFNPDLSQRERRKLNKKLGLPQHKKPSKMAVYDERGVHITGVDLCDCLVLDCPGCWFECPKCGSNKCGPECRVFRRYIIECIEYNGYDIDIKNPLIKK